MVFSTCQLLSSSRHRASRYNRLVATALALVPLLLISGSAFSDGAVVLRGESAAVSAVCLDGQFGLLVTTDPAASPCIVLWPICRSLRSAPLRARGSTVRGPVEQSETQTQAGAASDGPYAPAGKTERRGNRTRGVRAVRRRGRTEHFSRGARARLSAPSTI